MRYSASEKLEIIELVEQSTLAVGRTLASIGIPRSTFYDWYSRYQDGGIEALEDGKPRPGRVWNKIPDEIGTAIVNLALEEPDLSPRELAVNFTDTKGSFVSEASVYRLLKDHDLITSPAFILMKAADHFANPTTAPNQPLADRLHLPQGYRLGLVLSVHRARRLLALHSGLEAVHHHVGNGRVRYIAARAAGVRSGPGQGCASTTTAERQWPILCLKRAWRLAR
jgi:transposase-like protein